MAQIVINQGGMADEIVVPYGSRIRIGAFGGARADVYYKTGPSVNKPSTYYFAQSIADQETTLGSFAAERKVRIEAVNGRVHYSVDTAPALGLSMPDGPRKLYQFGVPFGIPSSGSIGNNGALSGITALPLTYSTGIWLYFPANAISAGSAAGLYWVVMSSTTAGTIYNNTYTPDGTQSPSVFPSSLTAFVTTGPGAYTQSTSEITLAAVTMQGGVMGATGMLDMYCDWAIPSNANNKTMKWYGGANIWMTSAQTTSAQYVGRTVVQNITASTNVASRVLTAGGAGTNWVTRTAQDTGVDTVLKYTGQVAVATDYVVLETGVVTTTYGA